ncbi:hypothetical protein H4R35_003596 [Dimargaris xerosporica]|nr:hypothetical protein H4R35_003596 [Dimargaris xerosporica]
MAGLRPLSVIPVAIDEKLPLTRALYSRDNLCATTQQQPLPLLFISQPSCVLQMPADLTQREESGEPSYRWQDGSFYFIKIAPLDNTEELSFEKLNVILLNDPYYFKTYPEVDPFVQSNESIATDSDSLPLPHQYGILTGYWHLDAIEWVSELGVAIIACQMGELALIRLIQDNTSTAVDEYICILEQYLPPGEHEDEVDVFSPRHRLIGFSVSRRECNDPQLRRYLLYFIYTDGIYSTYELRQPFWSLSAPLYNFL